MKPLGKKFMTIATTARQLTETFAKKHPDIGDPKDLACYCAIGSKILKLLAEKHNYKVTFVQGQYGSYYITSDPTHVNHCWVIYNNKIVDITATQFGIKDPVHVVDLKEAKHYFPVFHHDRIDKDWGDQNPKRYHSIVKLVENARINYV